jgi:hypothetical protein
MVEDSAKWHESKEYPLKVIPFSEEAYEGTLKSTHKMARLGVNHWPW